MHGDDQLALGLQAEPSHTGDGVADADVTLPIFAPVANVAAPRQHLSPAEVSPVYDAFWKFAAERQRIFLKRVRGLPAPWTPDKILREHKFTNAYRASDRVSQYLIRNVIYRPDLPTGDTDVVFRILLFKVFNKIETWERLDRAFGPITFSRFDIARYVSILSQALKDGDRIYSAAYIMPPGARQFGYTAKHLNHLRLIEFMMKDQLPQRLMRAKSMQDTFNILRGYPTIGDFLAYQFATDINYSEVIDFDENSFVMPGPGAKDGIRKCFKSLGGLTEADAIRLVAGLQESEFFRLGITFSSLWGRSLKLIDCQNLFCEISKYARVAYPMISGTSGRSRIKQKFRATSSLPQPWYPPKWGLNDRIRTTVRRIPNEPSRPNSAGIEES